MEQQKKISQTGSSIIYQEDSIGKRKSYEEQEEKEIPKREGCTLHLKTRKRIFLVLSFVVHFLAVLLILFVGAIVFAYLEDGDIIQKVDKEPRLNQSDCLNYSGSLDISMIKVCNESLLENLWKDIEKRYNSSGDNEMKNMLIQDFKEYINLEKMVSKLRKRVQSQQDVMFIFSKWLYFVVIVSTTIGYGDVTPKTQDGRLFFMFFAIFGIILVMTLLIRAGNIISGITVRITGFVQSFITWGPFKRLVSKEALSLFSLIILLIVYLVGGMAYGKEVHFHASEESLIDTIYFWIVTFSTVGFGDLCVPLEEEVSHWWFYILYRIFGLAILAAIVDATLTWWKSKKLAKTLAELNDVANVLTLLEKSQKFITQGVPVDKVVSLLENTQKAIDNNRLKISQGISGLKDEILSTQNMIGAGGRELAEKMNSLKDDIADGMKNSVLPIRKLRSLKTPMYTKEVDCRL